MCQMCHGWIKYTKCKQQKYVENKAQVLVHKHGIHRGFVLMMCRLWMWHYRIQLFVFCLFPEAHSTWAQQHLLKTVQARVLLFWVDNPRSISISAAKMCKPCKFFSWLTHFLICLIISHKQTGIGVCIGFTSPDCISVIHNLCHNSSLTPQKPNVYFIYKTPHWREFWLKGWNSMELEALIGKLISVVFPQHICKSSPSNKHIF